VGASIVVHAPNDRWGHLYEWKLFPDRKTLSDLKPNSWLRFHNFSPIYYPSQNQTQF